MSLAPSGVCLRRQLHLYPGGNALDSGLSLYLVNKDQRTLRAKAEFRMVNVKSSQDSSLDRVHGEDSPLPYAFVPSVLVAVFTRVIRAKHDWGFRQFLTSNELVDESLGFVSEGGWSTLVVKFTLLDTEEVSQGQLFSNNIASPVQHEIT